MQLPKLAKNIVGQKYGLLTAVEYLRSSNGAVWRFSCECGGFTELKASQVSGGHVKSCGCLGAATRFAGAPIQEMQKIGELTAVRMVGRQGHNLLWECICVCGTTFNATASNIISGNTRSCGCHKRKVSSDALRTHGLSGTRSHWIWQNMMRRCYDPKNSAYADYGERGIAVCERWHDMRNFYADMGERPKGRSLDRKNNDLGYSPENCRWSTSSEQNSNRRSIRLVVRGGVEKTIAEWSQITGIPASRMYARRDLGWSDDELFIAKGQKR